MKKLFILSLVMTLTVTAMAIPAKRGFRVVTNPDGTTLSVELRGDETFHYYVASDGTPVHKNENGYWETDTRDVQQLWKRAQAKRNSHRKELAAKTRHMMKVQRREEQTMVTKKGLLVLVEYKDKKFSSTDARTKEIFEQKLNALNNPFGRNKGSVREYFRDQSYGQLDIHFDVVGPVTLSQNMKYYGEDVDYNGNPSSLEKYEGNDHRPGEMILETLNLIKNQVNLADYDWDGDNIVENIYVTYAGYGQAVNGADPNTIWPHQWTLTEALGEPFVSNGVTVDTYACGPELAGSYGKTIDSNGTMCHEYSHCLGLPDFYDTDQSNGSNCGMADWSILDYGCYNGDGYYPAGYTAYERWFCGWLEPIELNKACTVTGMKAIEDEPVAYVIYNDNNHDEYYLLENHQLKGWDEKAQGHGMLILHVDYDEDAWYDNTVNNVESHQRMTIIPADNSMKVTTTYNGETYTYYQADDGDTYPGSSNNQALTDTSKPAAKLFNKNVDGSKFMHKDIEDITENEGLISFKFMGGATLINAPVAIDATEVTPEGFTANWEAVEGAVSYDLSLTETYDDGQEEEVVPIEEAMTIYEDFEAFYVDEDATSDGTTDLKDELDEYTCIPGWSGLKVYQGVYGAKLGTSREIGLLSTPSLTSTTGEVTIYLDAYDWFNYKTYVESETYKPDGSTLDVSIIGQNSQKQNVQVADMSQLADDEYPEIVLHFSDVPEEYHIMLSTTAGKKRVYLELFMAFDGNYTIDDINTLFEEEADEDSDELHFMAKTSHKKTRAMTKRRLHRTPLRKPVTNTSVISDIHATSYTFIDLEPGRTYTYRVRAIDADGNTSSWSNAITLTLPTYGDAITHPALGGSPAESIFDLSGRPVNTNKPSPGIYIRDGRKFIVQ